MKNDPQKTAVLTLDIQEGILGFVPGAEKALPQAVLAVETARKAGFRLMHVGFGFEPGYPEIAPGKSRFSRIRDSGAFLKGSDSARIHRSVFKPGDTVLYKNRVSAFAGSPLDLVLRAQGVENLVLMGIATSGIVLSTLRQASDLDYLCTVITDACFDRDEGVHRVLTEKVFAAQAEVLAAEAFRAQAAS
jgi:nicotinamidase-related amidase